MPYIHTTKRIEKQPAVGHKQRDPMADMYGLLREQTGVDFRIVSTDDLLVNEYNPNRMEQAMFESLSDELREEGGVTQTVIVRPSQKVPGKYEVVDGEHRLKGALLAGIPRLMVAVVPLTDMQAKVRTLTMNHKRGQDIPLKLAHLLVELQKEYSAEDLARMTGIAREYQINVVKLLEVPDFKDDQDFMMPITAEDVVRPISVSLMLMPDEHGEYAAAMTKAMGLGGPSVTALVGEEVTDYSKAMKEMMGLSGVKLRNVALAGICRAFLTMPEETKEIVARAIKESMEEKSEARKGKDPVAVADKKQIRSR